MLSDKRMVLALLVAAAAVGCATVFWIARKRGRRGGGTTGKSNGVEARPSDGIVDARGSTSDGGEGAAVQDGDNRGGAELGTTEGPGRLFDVGEGGGGGGGEGMGSERDPKPGQNRTEGEYATRPRHPSTGLHRMAGKRGRSRRARDRSTIFVAVPSPEGETDTTTRCIAQAIAQADHPDRLTFGVCLSGDPPPEDTLRARSRMRRRFLERYRIVNRADAKRRLSMPRSGSGPRTAEDEETTIRVTVEPFDGQKDLPMAMLAAFRRLYRGERFVMTLSNRARLAEGWDVAAIDDLDSCRGDSARPMLVQPLPPTSCGAGGGRGGKREPSRSTFLRFSRWSKGATEGEGEAEGIPVFATRSYRMPGNLDRPFASPFWTWHMSFADGDLREEDEARGWDVGSGAGRTDEVGMGRRYRRVAMGWGSGVGMGRGTGTGGDLPSAHHRGRQGRTVAGYRHAPGKSGPRDPGEGGAEGRDGGTSDAPDSSTEASARYFLCAQAIGVGVGQLWDADCCMGGRWSTAWCQSLRMWIRGYDFYTPSRPVVEGRWLKIAEPHHLRVGRRRKAGPKVDTDARRKRDDGGGKRRRAARGKKQRGSVARGGGEPRGRGVRAREGPKPGRRRYGHGSERTRSSLMRASGGPRVGIHPDIRRRGGLGGEGRRGGGDVDVDIDSDIDSEADPTERYERLRTVLAFEADERSRAIETGSRVVEGGERHNREGDRFDAATAMYEAMDRTAEDYEDAIGLDPASRTASYGAWLGMLEMDPGSRGPSGYPFDPLEVAAKYGSWTRVRERAAQFSSLERERRSREIDERAALTERYAQAMRVRRGEVPSRGHRRFA